MTSVKGLVLSAVVASITLMLAACGGSSASEPPSTVLASPTATSTATSVPSVAPSSTAMATATSAVKATPTATPTIPSATPTATNGTATASPTATGSSSDAALLAQGKFVFEQKAGNIGCQACHGMDAKGLLGPNIRGKTADEILDALGRVELMVQTIKNLDASDIEAVAAYLKYLATQP